jgi:hypothetical protein
VKSVPQRLKPLFAPGFCGTSKDVPFYAAAEESSGGVWSDVIF